MPPTIDIVMATYNGARFLCEQLDSVLAQARPGVRLLVRDDGSTDATREILAAYAGNRPEGVLVENGSRRLGACGSFSALLERSDADFVVLCDQDDVWLPGRLDAMLRRLVELEDRHGRGAPLLVHSDLTVVDAGLRELCPSFWRYQGLDPFRGGVLNRLLVQNVVTGCAAILNRALVRRATPIPKAAVMHDWWLATAAAALGRLEALAQPTALYRQHGENRVGAQRWEIGRASCRERV